jgi:Conserved in the green lineage and diatoms 27
MWRRKAKGNKIKQSLTQGFVFLYFSSGYPIAGATFTQDGFLLQKVAAANVGTLGLVLIILVRLYSGWGYVATRLQSKVIEYEETGWYDGNFEQKTEAEMKRDKFLYTSDVKPAVDRLKLLTLSAAALWVASCIGLNVATSMKPVFNEYDPSVLERVRYDEDFANKAAQQSGGKPTYCDNRYYRAVANGGQGCN